MSATGMPKAAEYPEPIVTEPAGEHKQSWIVLHGRGDEGSSFAHGPLGFLNLDFPDGKTIREHCPNTRFIFPTAKRRRARVFTNMTMTQWFDVYSWNTSEKSDWEIEGLRETTTFVHELLRREIRLVGAENVVLGGLSQGCASSLIALLLWTGEPIRCVFGMSGWLPMKHILESYEAKKDVEQQEEDVLSEALNALCKVLEIPVVGASTASKVPVLIAHGARDNKVEITLGHQAKQCLRELGLDVTWKEYVDLIHWMSGEELQDVVKFVEAQSKAE